QWQPAAHGAEAWARAALETRNLPRPGPSHADSPPRRPFHLSATAAASVRAPLPRIHDHETEQRHGPRAFVRPHLHARDLAPGADCFCRPGSEPAGNPAVDRRRAHVRNSVARHLPQLGRPTRPGRRREVVLAGRYGSTYAG